MELDASGRQPSCAAVTHRLCRGSHQPHASNRLLLYRGKVPEFGTMRGYQLVSKLVSDARVLLDTGFHDKREHL